MKIVLALTIASTLLLGGCVTTVKGDPLQPASDAKRVEAHLALARGYLETRNWQRARDPLEDVLAIDSTSAEAHTLLAIVCQAQGELELAEKHYRRALRYEPNNAQALNNYGSFLYSQGRFEEALEHLRDAVRDTGYHARAEAYQNLGLTELKAGTLEGAESAFQRALMLDSNLARANLELADIYYDKGNIPLSMRYYQAYTALARQNPKSLWLGIRLMRVFKDQDRLASYELLLQNLYPGSEEYRLYRESLE